jgi:hypothetical protein
MAPHGLLPAWKKLLKRRQALQLLNRQVGEGKDNPSRFVGIAIGRTYSLSYPN